MIKKMLILIGFILPLQIFAQNEIWVARYDGEANDYDGAFAMAVDDSGYIYVTGGSCDTSAMGWGDYATIKYNSAGDTLWVRRYNGPKNTADEAYAIAVDKNGNVYVTGRSCGIGTDYDYATIKYNSAGSEMWVRRYDRGGGAGYNDDEASAITVDDSKNVYVTGRFETIKYDSLGDTMWVRVFDGEAYAITVDNVKNVYVTGISAGSYDYLTIKYNSSGDTVWVRRYNGTGKGHKVINGYEEPKGDNYYKIKGIRKGLGGTGGVAIAVDNNGNVYVTGKNNNSGNTSSDYATIKYNSLGDTMWGRRYHGPDSTGWDGATALSIDNNGNVYVTGRSCDSGTDYDYATIKYDGSGDTLWVKKYSGPTKGNNCGTGIVVDNSGNVYVTGCSWG
ncbi:MAG: SBBP repeat-containing protein, partial [bacterium]